MSNRYTSLTTSKFDPLSLDEIMAVPLYKQKKHDELDQLGMEANASLKLDPDSKFYNTAQELKSKMDEKFTNLSSELAKNGYNPNMRSKFLGLKKEYDDLNSPMGLAGQINANKINKELAMAEYMKNATALGHNPDAVKRHLDNFEKQYMEQPLYDENGKVINFKVNELPSKYIDHVDYGRNIFKDSGITKKSWEKIRSSIEQTADGSYVLNKGFGQSLASNIPQLNDVLNFLNNQVINPNSDLNKSITYNGLTPQDVLKDYDNMFGIYKNYDESAKSSRQITNYQQNKPDNSKEKEEKPQPTLYRDEREEETLDINSRTYSDNKNLINELYNTPQNDPNYDANISKARSLEEQMSEINFELEQNSQYKNYNNKLKEYKNISGNNKNLNKIIEEGNINVTGIPYDLDPSFYEEKGLSKKDFNFLQKYGNSINKLVNEKNKIADDFISKYKMPYVSFVVDKTNDTSDYWKRHAEQLAELIGPDIRKGEKYLLDSVLINGDKYDTRNNLDAAKAVMTAFEKSTNKSITRYIIKNENSEPMIEFSFTPTEEMELDGMPRWDPSTEGNVTFRVALPNVGKGGELSNVENLFISSLEKNGGYQGQELANDMRAVSRFKDIKPSYGSDNFTHNEKIKKAIPFLSDVDGVNIYYDPAIRKYQYYVGSKGKENIIDNGKTLTWSDMLPNGLNDVKNIPSGLVDEFYDSFIKNNTYGINDKNFNNLDYQTRDKYLVEYFNTIKNNNLQFTSKENALRSFENK